MTSGEEIHTTAIIYVLDKTLDESAKELKEFLTQDCKINACDKEHWSKHLGGTIAETSANFDKCKKEKSTHTFKVDTNIVSIRDYGYLEELITDLKAIEGGGLCVHVLHHDVIIILGHSSVLLAEDKDLIKAFAKIHPTIIAFVGCCGGNTRYGPILTMSYLLPAYCTPIIAFYQRQVYKEELKKTNLMIRLKYYLHIKEDPILNRQLHWEVIRPCDSSITVRLAFGLKLKVSDHDPTVIINDTHMYSKNPLQIILNRSTQLKDEAVPLSCTQLAIYSPMVVDSKEFKQPIAKSEIIQLPKESCLEHELNIEDVLWQLDQQSIKITLYGAKQETETRIIEKSSRYSSDIKISGTLPKKITISEDPKWTEVSKDLRGIEVTLRTPSDSEIKSSDHEIKITLKTQGLETPQDIIYTVSKDDYENEIKLSCDQPSRTSISKNLQEINIYISPLAVQSITAVDELSKICWEKIEELQLHKIIPLICEIKFIKLFKNTLELLRKGDKSSWEKIDPLQFLVAVLRGHWGKNSLTDIKTWATYHLKKCMSNAKKSNLDDLHQYKLCCICFVLLFEDSFVRFVKSTEKNDHQYHQYDIIVCTKEEFVKSTEKDHTKEKNELEDIIKTDNSLQKLPESSIAPFPPDEELLSCWVDLLQHCRFIRNCVDLFNEDEHPKWVIGNQYGPEQEQQENRYSYKYEEFLLAMGALSDECQTIVRALINECIPKEIRKICYHVSKFNNKNDEKKGHMKCFNDDDIDKTIVEELGVSNGGVSFIETRLLLDSSKDNGQLKRYKRSRVNFNLIKELLDLYINDPAMWYLSNVPTLAKANMEALDQVINRAVKSNLYDAVKDILDQATMTRLQNLAIQPLTLNETITTKNILHQAILNQSIKNCLCQAIQDCTEKNWHKVSSCRFVFAQFMTKITPVNRRITGILFYTNLHYGENLIVFNKKQLKWLRENCTCYIKTDCEKCKKCARDKKCEECEAKCFDKLPDTLKTPYEDRDKPVPKGDWIEALKALCNKPCKYKMLEMTIKEIEKSTNKMFPFDKVGRLTLTYNDNGQLTEIRLDECAEYVAMETYNI